MTISRSGAASCARAASTFAGVTNGVLAPVTASTASAATIPPPAYAAVLLLTGLILVMGLYPEPFIHLAQVATAGFWNPGGVP